MGVNCPLSGPPGLRSILGPDLVFVVLDLEKGLQEERLKPRLGSFDKKYFDMKYEAAQDDEENTIDLKITREMELGKVVDIIISKTN